MIPKVSVIIPAYNAEDTLEKCLYSIINQSSNNYEIIVVDNRSTDRTKDIIKEFHQKKKSKKIKYVFESKPGRGATRNTGIKTAEGEIIIMTDSDCIVPKDWIKNIIRPITEGHEDVVMGSEKNMVENFWTTNIQNANWEFFKRNRKGLYISHIDTKNFAIKANILKKYMFDPKLGAVEDFELYLRLKNKYKIRFIPSIKVSHYHSSSFSQITKNLFERGFYTARVFKKHKKNSNLKNEVMTEGITLKNFILFLPRMFLQFFKKPFLEVYFNFISEGIWRVGVLWAIIKRNQS